MAVYKIIQEIIFENYLAYNQETSKLLAKSFSELTSYPHNVNLGNYQFFRLIERIQNKLLRFNRELLNKLSSANKTQENNKMRAVLSPSEKDTIPRVYADLTILCQITKLFTVEELKVLESAQKIIGQVIDEDRYL